MLDHAICCSTQIIGHDDEDNLVCTSCGAVLSDTDNFVTPGRYDKSTVIPGLDLRQFDSRYHIARPNRPDAWATTGLEKDDSRNRRYKFVHEIKGYLHALGLSTYEERITGLFWDSHQRFGLLFGTPSREVLAACIFTTVRKLQLPLTLDAIAIQLQVPPHRIGARLKELKSQFESHPPPPPRPDTFLFKICNVIACSNTELANAYFKNAQIIVKIARRAWLDQGRDASPIAAAAACLAFEAHTRRRAPPATFQRAANCITATEHVVQKRHREIMDLLIRCGRTFPFFDDLTTRLFYKALPDLIKHVGQDDPPDSVTARRLAEVLIPPAFTYNTWKREILRQRISAAKDRIRRTQNATMEDVQNEAGSGMNIRETLDQRIEALLLRGYTETQILDFRHKLSKRELDRLNQDAALFNIITVDDPCHSGNRVEREATPDLVDDLA